jgi:pilus assembly protein CpaB
MNRRLIGVFTFALVVAAATSALVYKLIVARVQAAPSVKQAAPTNRLVVAAHDLQLGALIADGDLGDVSWAGPVPEEAVKSRQDLVGRGVIATIYKDEPITERRLAPKGAGAGLAATIPIGKRAVALRVNEVIGLAGFVLPGMRVDVLIAGDVPSGGDMVGTRCKTVLQNIEVLSAGQKIEKSVDGKPESAEVVNLLVTPDQAEVLNLASTEAKVQLVLRNPLDTTEEPTHGTNVASLFGVKVAAPVVLIAKAAPAPAPAPPTVEVYNGAKRSEQALTTSLEKH